MGALGEPLAPARGRLVALVLLALAALFLRGGSARGAGRRRAERAPG